MGAEVISTNGRQEIGSTHDPGAEALYESVGEI